MARVVTERVQPAIRPLSSPMAVEAWHAPGEPPSIDEALAADYEPFTRGGRWGRPWGTTWFKISGAVPDDWANRTVEASIDLGFSNQVGFQAEGLIWEPGPDGRWSPWRGLHPLNHHVPVVTRATGGEQVSYLVEAAANPPLVAQRPDRNSDLLTAGTDPIYSLNDASLYVLDADVYGYREDVRALIALMGELAQDQPRHHEIIRALERSLDVLVLDDIAGSVTAARGELAEVLARPASPSAHRISAIGHAHIDSAWLWPLRETMRKCSRTFSNVLRLMDEYPEFEFGCSQAVQYQWMRDRFPAVFDQIVDRVAEGRWIPLGGMWVEADTNLTGGEALIRQFTHGQRFFEEHFGVTCEEVWLPDVFGYPAGLPQIMRLAGCERFLTQKLSWNTTNRFPHHTFWWEGIDGSTVFTHFPPVETYNATFDGTELAHAVRTFNEKGRATRSLLPFGWGDGGGGPNRRMLEQFRRVRDLEGSPRIEIESPSRFFEEALAEYPDAPRWVGELYFEMHRGTYTSQARTKAGNRRCELLLREAELWATAAVEAGHAYPAADLDRLWKVVLLHQFHDILPGSSIAWVHRETEMAHAEVIAELEAIIAASLDAMVGSARSRTAMVANPAPHDRDEVIVFDATRSDALVRDGQVLSDGRIAVRVVAPALGLATIGLATHGSGTLGATGDRAASSVPAPVTATARRLFNGLISVILDDDGLICSIVDHRAGGRELVAAGARANLLQLHPDLPNAFDAWDLDDFYRRQVLELDAVDSIEVLDPGPLIGRIRVNRRFRSSSVSQIIELRAGSARIDVRCEIDWQERDHVLKVAFPLDVHTDEITREIQFGHVRTAIHTNTSWDAARFEVCAHRWVDVSEAGYGVALLNDSKYGHDATRTRSTDDSTSTTVRLTLLKGAQYPDPFADQGIHRFGYALLAHDGDLQRGEVVAEGYRFNMAPRLIGGGGDATERTETRVPQPLVAVDGSSVVIETVKRAEDGSGDIVVRGYESHGGRSRVALRTAFDFTDVRITDVHERENASVPAVALEIAGRSVGFMVRPFQIVTLRFRGVPQSAAASRNSA